MDQKDNNNYGDINVIDDEAQLQMFPMVVVKGDIETRVESLQNEEITRKTLEELAIKTIEPTMQYVPPLNFSLVEDGIYRSGFPLPINYLFLKRLGLKTIIYIGDIGIPTSKSKKTAEHKESKTKKEKRDKEKPDTMEIMDNYKKWIATTDITFHLLPMESSQEPFLSGPKQKQSQETLTRALQLMLDKHNFPMLIHSNKGKHRIGVLVGLMRKILQGWCLSGIFEEYEKFALGKSEFDLEFIELWQPELYYESNSKPSFVRV